MKIIDKWVDKWGYILRSLNKKTKYISSDLSGGFDTRISLSILLNSGIELNKILINSINSTKHTFEEDFKIASNISSKFGFKLNNIILDNKGTKLSTKDSLFCSIYTKLGFHKEFYPPTKFFIKPRFAFTGSGGELLRGKIYHIKKYIEEASKQCHGKFYNSSKRFFNRNIALLKKQKTYYNNYEVSADFYFKGRARHHFGRGALESFLINVYMLQPLIDPDIKQIKFDINENSFHDLIAYIYVRFGQDLIYFPFQGKRQLDQQSVKKAKKINKNFLPYEKKSDYNKNFFIDIKRKSPVPSSKNNKNVKYYLKKLFNSPDFIRIIDELYDNDVYNWSKEYSQKSNYHPLRHGYALFAIVKLLEDLSKNKSILTNYQKLLDLIH